MTFEEYKMLRPGYVLRANRYYPYMFDEGDLKIVFNGYTKLKGYDFYPLFAYTDKHGRTVKMSVAAIYRFFDIAFVVSKP